MSDNKTIRWHIVLTPLDGTPPSSMPLTRGGKSLDFCRVILSDWRDSMFNDGHQSASIEPLEGWEAVGGDPLAAIVYAVAARELDPALAVARINKLFEGGQNVSPR